eukprot:SAG31_NODE_604_length_13629_cov_11.035994_14_plen_79_part_00
MFSAMPDGYHTKDVGVGAMGVGANQGSGGGGGGEADVATTGTRPGGDDTPGTAWGCWACGWHIEVGTLASRWARHGQS